MTLIALVVAIAVPTQAPEVVPYWQERGCTGWHTKAVARDWLRRHVRSTRPQIDRQRVQRIKTCVPTEKASRGLGRLVKRWRHWRRGYIRLWHIRFNRLAPWERAWAVSTGACESGNNPTAATGNGYYGAHQWLPSTWAAADSTGIWVTLTSWYHQAVVAVRWRRVAGDEQWPVCGD